MCIIDVNPISLGIRLHDGKVSTLIKKNSPVPTRETKRFTNQEENQQEISVCIMQGDSPHGGQIREEHCKTIADFNIGPFNGMKAREAMIEITFTVDQNGVLNVSVVDKKGKMGPKEVKIADALQFSDEEMNAMRANLNATN